MIDQCLTPAYQAECTEDLWLNLDWNVEILRWLRASFMFVEEIKPGQLHTLQTEQRL